MEGFLSIHPFHSPFGFLFDDINIGDGIEKIIFLIFIFDVGIKEKGISLRMNIFHGDLKSIETASLRDLNLGAKLFCKILKDDSIWGGKKG